MSHQQELDLQSFLVSPPAFDLSYGNTQSPANLNRYGTSLGLDPGNALTQASGSSLAGGPFDSGDPYASSYFADQLRQQPQVQQIHHQGPQSHQHQHQHQQQQQQQQPQHQILHQSQQQQTQQPRAALPNLSNVANADFPRPGYASRDPNQSGAVRSSGSAQIQNMRPEETKLNELDPATFNPVSFAMPRFLEGSRNSPLNTGPAVIDGGIANSITTDQMNFGNLGSQSVRSRSYNGTGGIFDSFGTMPYQFDAPSLLPDGAMSDIARLSSNVASGSARPLQPSQQVAPAGSTQYPGVYSSTGFDIIGILARIALRQNPQLDLGPVDLSASFLVVDAQKYDFPIVYASPSFSKLTGYSQDECTGRNCRFLQAPDGNISLGSRRQHTDNNAVFHIKSHMLSGKECQASLVNYRKGGQSFFNLVTVIPITWNSDEIAYFIGFQIDLVEQPNAILDRLKDGTYVVNYSQAKIPRSLPFLKPPKLPSGSEKSDESDLSKMEKALASKQTQSSMPVSKQDSPEIMDIIEASEDTDSGRRQWNRMLLEHSDDFIHVLSLKGVFLYASPSVRRLLGFSSDDLTGKNISTICHPSDTVPVMRELKESTTGIEDVSLVYRIRRKDKKYIWIESYGKLHLEQGKGRKCVIMVGRQRSVYSLRLGELSSMPNEIYRQEFWMKLSLDGMILYVTPSVKEALGFLDQEMIGMSFMKLVASEQLAEFQHALLGTAQHQEAVLLQIRTKVSSYAPFITKLYRDCDSQKALDGQERLNKPFILCQALAASTNSKKTVQEPVSIPAPAGESVIKPPSGSMWKTIRGQARSPSDNLFDGLNTSGSTSWQYELHQLRLTNKKLREEIETVLDAQSRWSEMSNFICHRCKRKGTLNQASRSNDSIGSCNACGAAAMAPIQPQRAKPTSPPSESSSIASSPSPVSDKRNHRDGTPSSVSSSEGETSPEIGDEDAAVSIEDRFRENSQSTASSPSMDMALMSSMFDTQEPSDLLDGRQQ